MLPLTKLIIAFWLLLSVSFTLRAQEDVAYKRSALHLVLIDQEEYFGINYLKKAFYKSAFPDNYDRHAIEDTILRISDYMTYQERIQSKKEKKERVPDVVKHNAVNLSKGITDVLGEDDEKIKGFVEDYIDTRDVARKLVAKWFLRDSAGTFTMDEVMRRGAYNASMLDAATAESSAMGMNLIRDAGSELIKNTFIVFTNLNLVDNKPFVDALSFSSSGRINSLKTGRWTSLKNKVVNKGTDKLENGYNIWTTGYLYRLKWNEETESIFFNEMWISRGDSDPERKALFETTDLFELEFIGYTYAQSLVTEKLLKEEDQEDLVTRATIRNVEACYAKLQQQYDVFKPKVPLVSADPVAARIGMKEGLEGGEKFEVLEIREDPETGLRSLHRIDVIRVDDDRIWDNRYGADELLNSLGEEGLDRTYFKGGGSSLLPGMLIRQIK